MSKPLRRSWGPMQHNADLLAFARRAAEQGVIVQLPAPDPERKLPEPVDLSGASLADMVVELRRCEP